MVRRPRIEIEAALYHVCNRFSSGEANFADPDDAIDFVDAIREVKKRDGWTDMRHPVGGGVSPKAE